MSPEQEQGVPLLRPASDVYALGIVLFELLTGRNYALLKPGTHAASLRENVPVWLDELLTRMLAEDPKVRPWNGEEAAGLLLAGMEAEQALQVVAQKTWQDEQARQARNAEEKTVREAEERLREAERERQERQNAEQRRLQAEAEAKQKKLQQKSQPKRKFPVWAFFLIVLAGITGIVSLLPKQPSPSQTAVPTAVVRTPVIPATAMSAISAPSTVVPTFTLVPTLGIGSTWPRSADRMVMVYVPEGNFIMGSNDETIDAKPQHTVYLDAYWIDKTDVTNSMFEIFINQTGYQTDAEKSRSSYVFNTVTDKWESTLDANWKHPQGSNSSLANLNEHPVVQVSWNDAQAYCKWADARLPTEAEWEKAARGTDGRKYPWGNQAPTGDLSNFADVNLVVSWADKTNNDGYEFTSPVGSYPAGASPYGALDMAGNVSQWVNDWWDPNYYANSPSSNPQGPSSGTQRLKPGGSWYDGQLSIQSAFRPFDVPGWTDESSGFRCARS
jgi:formylglycine-generating enzyme required for sulfatase activity